MPELSVTNTRPGLRLSASGLSLVLVAQACAMSVHAVVATRLMEGGQTLRDARELAFLAVPPVLAVLLYPVLRAHAGFIRGLFDPRRISLWLILVAITLGVLLRVAWWAQLITRVAFGLTKSEGTAAAVELHFHFDCPPIAVISLGVLVMAVLVPTVEEVVNRGIIQSSLSHRGAVFAVVLSAAIFTLFHAKPGYPFVFLVGLVIGVQFWKTQAVWTGIATHATYNGLVQVDWRCLNGTWIPAPDDLPLYYQGAASLGVLVFATLAIGTLLIRAVPGRKVRPGTND